MPTIISVASGKGGVGKSFVVSNLGVLFAKAGRQVTLADLDVGGADLHILFGMLKPKYNLTSFLTKKTDNLQDILLDIDFCKGLKLLAGSGDTLATANPTYSSKQRLIRHIKQLPSDIVIADIGAGASYHALDFFLMAHYPVIVITPDPTAIFDAYKFIKLAAIRKVLTFFVSRSQIGEELLQGDFNSIQEVLNVVDNANAEADVQAMAEQALRSFKPFLIFNRVDTTGAQFNVAQLGKVLKQYVGSELEMLGEIPVDKQVLQSVHSYLPLSFNSDDAAAVSALQKISNTMLTRLNFQAMPSASCQ